MPMIDTDQLKPSSETVQDAFNEWWDAGQELARLRDRRPTDQEKITEAQARVEILHDDYSVLAQEFARAVRDAIRAAKRQGQ
ncbi:hypothetical protein JFT42_17615 [Pseudomonas haemolytica]|uniref:hypothetical protein n=1 Tax=Pseudomonas haemolytica TaxID=2600065 RepID=UPI0018E8ADC3|nr:hypothetical protein [Pseudomonas haemolytica]MBJ2247479.1 hypothetical protein [Pseudomonas haemolytica]